MSNVIDKILEISPFVEECYIAQTKCFSPVEYPYLCDVIRKNSINNVLDVGTGEGNFLKGLADLMPGVTFHAIDADISLIALAKKKSQHVSITYENSFFGPDFPDNRYDLITARFAVEHMPDTGEFIRESYKRLAPGGLLIITEYYVDTLHSWNKAWTLFREKEFEMYEKIGSHPRVALEIPGKMKEAGFSAIESSFRHISPSTAGAENFYRLVISYARLYRRIRPDIWTERIEQEVIEHCQHSRKHPVTGQEDIILISHTFGKRIVKSE